MKILIIDRDQLVSQIITTKLGDGNIEVYEESVKNQAMERLAKERFDVVMVDPSPMKEAQALVMNIRRSSRSYPYVIIMGEEQDKASAIKSGANNFMVKPIDFEQVKKIINDAQELQNYSNLLGDLSEDFPSAGGVIAKSAFNQLYLSSIDRSWRYGESTHILSVSIENYKEIHDMDGEYHANYGVSKLAHHLTHLRRQSDVIGQIKVNQYALLLQRTSSDTEAEDAAKRFAVTLDDINDFIPPEGNPLRIRVQLMDLPTGRTVFNQVIIKKPNV